MSKFFQLICSMPTPFQQAYWAEVLNLDHDGRSWRSLISQASIADIEEILNAIADRWADLGKAKAKEKELATVY
jgi:hypothetical protein